MQDMVDVLSLICRNTLKTQCVVQPFVERNTIRVAYSEGKSKDVFNHQMTIAPVSTNRKVEEIKK